MSAPARPPNVFAGPHVLRDRPPRKDAEAVRHALSGASARIVPVWRSRNLLLRSPAPAACLLEVSEQLRASLTVAELVLLGEYQGYTTFAWEITDESTIPRPEGAEFADLRMAGGLLTHGDAGLLAYARALLTWRSRHRYCGACGAATEPRHAGHVMACTRPGCGTEAFPRVDPAVIVLVIDGERALLGRQASWPAGRYSTIAGFVEPGESLEDAVSREVQEETGIEVDAVVYHSSQPWPFPSSLMLGFHAHARTTRITCNDAELEDARWFTRAQIRAGEPLLPPPLSISWRLIAEWYDADSPRPLAEETGAQRWEQRR